MFNHALHSLRNPHFPCRSKALVERTKQDNEAEAEETTFNNEIRSHLSRLAIPADRKDLTLPWLQDGVKSVLIVCSHVSQLLPRMTCSDKEKVLLESNLEDTLSLLDVCNGLKEALNDVQHYVMLVRYAVRSAVDVKDTPDEELNKKLSRLSCAIVKSADFLHARVEENGRHQEGRSKLETCRSMLRRIGEPLPKASPGSKRAASNALFNDMHAAKVLTVFVCSVFAFALSVKPKRPLACVLIAEEPTWMDFLQNVQQNMKKISDKGIEHGKFAFLKELDDLHIHTHELEDALEKFSKQEMPAADIDKASLGQQCEKLTKESDDLQQGLLDLQKEMDRLFRMLITIRFDFLDTLCHV